MSIMSTISADEIIGIISGVTAGIVAIITAVTTLINANRKRNCKNPKCCLTGRKLKPKQKKDAEQKV